VVVAKRRIQRVHQRAETVEFITGDAVALGEAVDRRPRNRANGKASLAVRG
jgi:hypothetical protein